MFTLFSWCSDCQADTEFDLVADTMTNHDRSAEYACRDCGAAILVPQVTAHWALTIDRRATSRVA
jgi:DNA-directed RNA polymerase subunit RPC12/RpoP